MRLIDLDQKIIVPIVDEMAEPSYEVQMTVGEFFDRFLEGNKPEIVEAVPVVHASWKDNGNGTISCRRCSTWFPKEREPYMRFCGCCGAKMDGEAR